MRIPNQQSFFSRSQDPEEGPVQFGRDICGRLSSAETREWLVTNGIGGFAGGTVAGLLTRRYHGLLIAALKPPVDRTLLVSKIEETAGYDGQRFELSTNRWAGGLTAPQGFRLIERFYLEGTSPVWIFALADALLEKRLWMHPGENTTWVSYQLLRAGGPVDLELKFLVNYRDFHSGTHAGDWRMDIQPMEMGLQISAYPGAAPFFLLSEAGSIEPAHTWYRDFDLAQERYRGLDDREDHLHAGTCRFRLAPGQTVSVAASTLAQAMGASESWRLRADQESELLQRWESRVEGSGSSIWSRQLVLAADQFVVRRPLPDDAEALSIIAGYPWFSDWGRDTMIALPGLTLSTGRPEVAQRILRAFSHYVDRGMLPNYFPDAGQVPEYNTVDAALWYLESLRQYFAQTEDVSLLQELYPILQDIVDWHVRGTRYEIHRDPQDGLLYAGRPGVQLTWMDAKVGDWVVTPRIGKPVEVNALWYNALRTMGGFAAVLGRPAGEYESLAQEAKAGFGRFWNAQSGCCFDVLDGPDGNDDTLRPNQILAVSLAESPLAGEQQRAVVEACSRHLLTAHGLRSLAPGHPSYQGVYAGGPAERDAAYHQGTVWGWLLGPFALAYWKVHGEADRAASFLQPLVRQMMDHGLGTLGEIFDGAPPFSSRGCIAQAWTVAETLRCWRALELARAGSQGNLAAPDTDRLRLEPVLTAGPGLTERKKGDTK